MAKQKPKSAVRAKGGSRPHHNKKGTDMNQVSSIIVRDDRQTRRFTGRTHGAVAPVKDEWWGSPVFGDRTFRVRTDVMKPAMGRENVIITGEGTLAPGAEVVAIDYAGLAILGCVEKVTGSAIVLKQYNPVTSTKYRLNQFAEVLVIRSIALARCRRGA